MSDQPLGTGFHFSKFMAWAPVIVGVSALVLIVRGQLVPGLLVAVASILVWIIVRRRRDRADSGTRSQT